MDNKLVLTVLFVTLSWISVGTYAQSSTTNATTTTGSNMTTTMSTPGNMTTTMSTPGNMTTTMSTPGNMTTTMSTPGNMTTPTSTPGNMTTPTPTTTTTAPPLIANTTVEPLQATISRTQCGTQQLCGEEPDDCDPTSPGSCFFIAAEQINGNNFMFEVSGDSDGYLAATVSTDNTLGGNDPTYVCANDNGVVRFFSTRLNNGMLTVTELNVNSVRGSVNGRRIQCTFAATVPNPSTRASGVSLSVLTGTFNSTSGSLGSPVSQLRSPVVDLGNPNATIVNQISSTTSNMTTTTPTTTTMTTTAPPLIANTTVEALQTTLNRTQCGTQQLCGEEPNDCDPASPGSCFFISIKQISGNNFMFGLSGDSDGYVAATVSTDNTLGGNDPTYVCANNNGVVQFISARLNNGVLTPTDLNVNSVRGSVNGRRIQCTFAATVPDPSTRASAALLLILTGPFNSIFVSVGSPTAQFQGRVVDLGNSSASIINQISTTTTTTTIPTTIPTTTTPTPTTTTTVPPTTAHAIRLQQSLTQALLITVVLLGLSIL